MNQGIKNIAVIIAALLIAVLLGQWVVTDPKLAGIAIAIFAAIALFFILHRHAWMLVPAFSVLSISFPWIPGGLTPVELASIYVIACSVLLLVTRKISLRVQMTSIEWLAILIALSIGQAFLRNPAGINMMGSEYVGGRAYFVMALAFMTGLILASTKTNHERIRKLFNWSVGCFMASTAINLLAYVSGTIASYTGVLFGAYGKFSPTSTSSGEMVDPGRAGRNTGGVILADMCSRCLVAWRHPLKALLHPFWGIVLLAALMGAGMSGFRSVIASTGLTLALGVFYWGRGRAVLLALALAVLGYIGANVVNMVTPLPANIQRSLSFLPGTWEAHHIEDVKGSTNWRVEMWEDALTSDRYIENKIFGDGLGIRRDNYQYMMEISNARVISDEMSQERAMLAGDFHSGPVSAVRVVGFVGFISFIIAMLVVAYRAHKLIIYSRCRPYFREVIFFCLPMVWSPVFFIFVFGDFKAAAPLLIVQMGLLRLLEINLRDCSDEL